MLYFQPDIERSTFGLTNVDLKELCEFYRYDTGTYLVGVYAVDSNYNQISYQSMEYYNYTAKYPKLATPSNVRFEGKKLKWNGVQNCTGYIIEAYDELDRLVRQDYTEETQFDYTGINSFMIGNEYRIGVKAIDDMDLRPSSDFGYAEYFEGWFIKGYIENWQVNRGVADWKDISQANYYYVSFYDQYGSYLFTNSVSNNYANLYKMAKDEGLANGTYGLLIWAVDGDYVEITHKLEKVYTYEANKYCTVTFHLYNSYDYPENIVPGGYAYEPTNLHKLCCKMNGWYLNNDWIGFFDLLNQPINQDMDLYGFWELVFSDLDPSRWYMPYVDYVYNMELMTGYSGDKEGMFGPNDTINRAQIVTILYRNAGKPTVYGEMSFSDIPSSYSGNYYYDAVRWAANNGIVTGYLEGPDAGKFKPYDPITREQLAVILQRYAAYCGKNSTATQNISGFVDANQVSGYATNAMKWAVAVGIIKGNSNGTLNPKGTATRAEAAAMIMRFIEEL